MNIIQWNCNGVLHHLEDLRVLISEIEPKIVCIQESHLRPGRPFDLKPFEVFRKDKIPNKRACGGVVTLLNKPIACEEVQLESNLQAEAVLTHIPSPVCICNVYIPPDQEDCEEDLQSLIDELPKPFLLVGDFNAHSKLWSNPFNTNRRGNIIERVLDCNNLVILNNSDPIHLDSGDIARFEDIK